MSKISAIRADEYEAWKMIFSAFIAHMSASLPEEQFRASWARIFPLQSSLKRDPELWCLVAREDDGSIVGFAQWLKMGRSWKENKEIYLEDLFVLPSHCGKGYGKALLLAVAEEGHKQGSDAMHWTTGIQNLNSTRLYDRVAHFGHRWYSMDLPYKPKVQEDIENVDGA